MVLNAIMVWGGRHFNDHPVPPPGMGRDTFQNRLSQAPLRFPLNARRDGGSHSFLWAICWEGCVLSGLCTVPAVSMLCSKGVEVFVIKMWLEERGKKARQLFQSAEAF